MPFIYAVWMLWLAFVPLQAAAKPPTEAAIRQLIQSTWDTPQARVEVAPVVVQGRHAVADWTQGTRGGRALLTQDRAGHWAVLLCAGDALKDAKVLESAGVSPHDARLLSAALRRAEQPLPAERKARFAAFEGMVAMGHAAHH